MFSFRNFIAIIIFVGLVFVEASFEETKEEIIKNIESKSVLKRRHARKALAKYLEALDENERASEINGLLKVLRRPRTSYQFKLGVCYAISHMREVFWEVENFEEMRLGLYNLFKKEKNRTLKEKIDDTLMTAKGLYWDAIHGYNQDRVDDPEAVAQKFRNVFVRYPASSYAPKARFFLAQYFSRVYFILESRSQNPDQNIWIQQRANMQYRALNMSIQSKIYVTDKMEESRYYLALNYVLGSKMVEARSELEKIMEESKGKNNTIFIYQFYYSTKKSDVVNRYYPASDLARYTLEYLNRNPEYNDDYLSRFVSYLKRYTLPRKFLKE